LHPRQKPSKKIRRKVSRVGRARERRKCRGIGDGSRYGRDIDCSSVFRGATSQRGERYRFTTLAKKRRKREERKLFEGAILRG